MNHGLHGFILPSALCILLTGCWSDYWGKKHFWNPQGRIEMFETVSPVTNAFAPLSVQGSAPTAATDSGGYPVDAYDVIVTVREHTKAGWGPRAAEKDYLVQ